MNLLNLEWWGYDPEKLIYPARPTATAQRVLGNNFLPVFNIKGSGSTVKQRLVLDPEWAVSAAEFGWDFPANWGVAKYSPEGEYKSMNKYYTLQRHPPDDHAWSHSFDYMNELWAPDVANFSAATHEEVVWSLDGTKSPGPPFNKDYSDTYAWLEEYGQWLAYAFDNYEESWLNLWSSRVKEELRPSEKLALNKVRVFAPSNKAYQYNYGRLFRNALNGIVAGCGTRSGHTIGMSKYASHWTDIGNYVDELPNKFDYDVATCDGEVQNHEKVDYLDYLWFNMRKEDRTPHNHAVFLRIKLSELFSLMVDGAGVVWLVPNGTKSGSPDTTTSTTWIVKRRFVYAYFKIMGFDGPGDYARGAQSFRENVRHMGQGDDGLFSVSDVAVTRFNYKSIKALWEKNGWHLETLSELPRDLDSVVFLSNWFRKLDRWWIPVPCSDKGMASMAHTRKRTPAMSLARAFALYQECFYSDPIRERLALHIARLRKKYEKTQKNNTDWQLAMTMLKADAMIERLYLDPSTDDQPPADFLEDLN